MKERNRPTKGTSKSTVLKGRHLPEAPGGVFPSVNPLLKAIILQLHVWLLYSSLSYYCFCYSITVSTSIAHIILNRGPYNLLTVPIYSLCPSGPLFEKPLTCAGSCPDTEPDKKQLHVEVYAKGLGRILRILT